jgi:hypothetical protein
MVYLLTHSYVTDCPFYDVFTTFRELLVATLTHILIYFTGNDRNQSLHCLIIDLYAVHWTFGDAPDLLLTIIWTSNRLF